MTFKNNWTSIHILDSESSDSLRLKSGDQVLLAILGKNGLILWLLLELLDERCGLVGLPWGVLSHRLLVVSLTGESSLFNLNIYGRIKSLLVFGFSVELLSEFVNIELHVLALTIKTVLHVLNSNEDLVLSIGIHQGLEDSRLADEGVDSKEVVGCVGLNSSLILRSFNSLVLFSESEVFGIADQKWLVDNSLHLSLGRSGVGGSEDLHLISGLNLDSSVG